MSHQMTNLAITINNPLFQLVMRLTGQRGKGVVQKVSHRDNLGKDTHFTQCKTRSLQALCEYIPSPLDTSFPGGMFGAIEEGQEEAIKFYQAWKAEVIVQINGSCQAVFFHGH